jgi:hypothetical protein
MTAEQKISQMMSAASRARTQASRQRGGSLAWKTRIENLRSKLERLESRQMISGNHAGK